MESWWRDAVVYQIYPRSFHDSNGDGEGDLVGITRKLPYLVDLGVDALWLSPFYPSPLHDSGYDVSDYCDIDPRFGTLADFDALVAAATHAGLRVLVDVVPNHCSAEHPLFQDALRAGPGSPERDLFMFRRSTDPAAETPPNNWQSFFGGSAWTRLPDGDWYLHLFDSSQPDWNWRNPAVHELFEQVLRFWLDRGVAGFRVDVGNALYKAEGLPDLSPAQLEHTAQQGDRGTPYQDQPELIEHYGAWRALLDSYGTHSFPGQRIMVGETWADSPEAAIPLIDAGMTQSFDFRLITAPWDAGTWRQAIAATYDADLAVGTTPWAIGNHDVPRLATRLGVDETELDALRETLLELPVNVTDGNARARAAALIVLGLPGSAYVYQGDELGLPENLTIPAAQRQDPMFLRGTNLGRDGCRAPLPWAGSEPPYGFSDTAHTWLPTPPDWAELTVAAQEHDPDSTLQLYREALRLRREISGDLEWAVISEGHFVYRRGKFFCLANFGPGTLAIPHHERRLSSRPLTDDLVPPDTAVWFWV